MRLLKNKMKKYLFVCFDTSGSPGSSTNFRYGGGGTLSVKKQQMKKKKDMAWSILVVGYILGLLSLILKSLIKSLMPKAPVGASIRLLHMLLMF